MPAVVTEHVLSYTGKYGAWLISQGWTGTPNKASTRVDNWVEIRTNNGAHGGARPPVPFPA